MSILVIADTSDLTALAVYRRLKRMGLPIILALSPFLSNPRRIVHRVSNAGKDLDIDLADGTCFGTSNVCGVLNRASYVPPVETVRMDEVDAGYVLQETQALLLSWLYALADRCINKAHPTGVAGPAYSIGQWRIFASRAGLSVEHYISDTTTRPDEPSPLVEAVILGDRVFAPIGMDLDEVKLIAMARLLGLDLMGAYFSQDQTGEWLFHSATALPTLLAEEPEFVDTLAGMLLETGGK